MTKTQDSKRRKGSLFTQPKPQRTPSVHHAQTFNPDTQHRPVIPQTTLLRSITHSSSFPSFFCPPPTSPPSQDAPGMATRAARGYDLPSTSTLGSQEHQSSSGTPDMAAGMCFPHPRHDFFAVTPGAGQRQP